MKALSFLVVAAFVSQGLAAELPVIRLDTLFPPGGKAGSDVDVAITGADLDEAKAIHFSHPGITTVPKEKGFTVKIAADVPVGVYDARVIGLLGVSNPRAFVVGDLPHVAEPATNNKPDTALEIAVDSSVCGTANAAAADFFKFTAKAGQRLIVDCDAAEIDSLLNPIIAIIDGNGSEVAASRRGGTVDFTVARDGTYLIRIHDLTYGGGPNHFYRLTLSSGPHLDFIMPPCAKPGGKSRFTLFGRNLPGGAPVNLAGHDGRPLERVDVEIDVPEKADARIDGLANPAAAAVPGFSYRIRTPRASNPVFVAFTSLPVIAEQEPNNAPDRAQKLTGPCEVAGQYFPAADTDIYTFDAKKGEVWWVEIISRRVEISTSPFLLIQRENADVLEAYGSDANVGGARFGTASGDPVLRFEVKEDGTYRIKTRDLLGASRKDPRNTYRLALRREPGDFELAVLADPPPEKKDDRSAAPRTALIRADGTSALKVVALRRDGFGGEIELSADNLPAGVTAAPAKIAAGANEGLILLTGVEKPNPGIGAIRVTGKAKAGESEVIREARGGVVQWTVGDSNNEPIRSRLTREIALAVSAEPAPLSIAAAEEKRFEIPAGGKAEIPLKVTRRGEFKEALKLKAAGPAGIENLKEIDVAPADAKAVFTLDLAAAKIPVGEHIIHFTAQTKGKFRGKDVVTTVYSAPIRVGVLPPPPAPAAAPATAAAPVQPPQPK
jgi:hypothetical protein